MGCVPSTPTDFYRRRTDLYFTRGGGVESLERVRAVFAASNPAFAKALGRDADYLEFLRRNRHRAAE